MRRARASGLVALAFAVGSVAVIAVSAQPAGDERPGGGLEAGVRAPAAELWVRSAVREIPVGAAPQTLLALPGLGRVAVACGRDGTASVRVSVGREGASVHGAVDGGEAGVRAIALDPGRSFLAGTGGRRTAVQRWTLGTADEARTLTAVASVASVPAADGSCAVVAQATLRRSGHPRSGRLQVARAYAGVSCRRPNRVGCDRIGLAVWLPRQRFAAVAAVVGGRRFPLRRGRGGLWSGHMRDAGLRAGALRVPARHGIWLGADPPIVRAAVYAERFDGRQAVAVVGTPLRPGWG